jgi:hypothetical protein
VKPGTKDEDHPDLPLGGWAGTISKVHKRGLCSVRWSRETLASVHPIYRKRCAIDGLVLEEYTLREDDLELDPGGPLAIEQPTRITPRPLSQNEPGDRVRMIFGLTSDDFLPAVNEDSLETYYDHLVDRMSLPVEARYLAPAVLFMSPRPRCVRVLALDHQIAWEVDSGILCRIRTAEGEEVVPLTDIEFRRSDPNHQLLSDFASWFFGELGNDEDEEWDDDEDEEWDDDEDEDDSDVVEEATGRPLGRSFLELFAFATSYGAVVGAAVAAIPWANWAACIGAGVWGLIVTITTMPSAQRDMTYIMPKFRKGLGGYVALTSGALHGAFFGIMAVAFIGTLVGGVAGLLLRRLLGDTKAAYFVFFPGTVLLAVAVGITAQAFYLDPVAAGEGLRLGMGIGLGSALPFCLVSLLLVAVLSQRPSRRDRLNPESEK